MEPLPKERSDGSQKTSHLTCNNATGCEHHCRSLRFLVSVQLSRCVIWPLTWVRALPGDGGST